jgi:RNA polymerase sigma-70 factor (ECF subfamily)
MPVATQHTAPASSASSDPGDRTALLIPAFRDNRHAMYRAARSICGDDCAADVVQEVFLRVWRSFAFDPTRGSMRSYLLTVTRGVAVDMVRRNAAARRRDCVGTQRTATTDDADGAMWRDADKSRVDAALDLLHAREREVVVAAFYDGLTHRQIAVRLALPEGTVKSRIRVAMTKLRYHLRDDATRLEGVAS